MRKNGAEALERLLKGARGMREHLIEDALDGDAFHNGSIEEQRARLRAVLQILPEESDPNLRAMVKTYADQLSSKLVVGGKALANLRELESAVEQAITAGSRPSPRRRPEQELVAHDRARSRARHEDIGLDILGAVLDFPELLHDPDIEPALASLDGDVALAVAALRRTLDTRARDGGSAPKPPAGGAGGGHPASQGHDLGPEMMRQPLEIGVYADEFLAQIPRPIHSFAVGRLASPEFETVEVAKSVLLDNARKLSSLSLKRENAAEIEQLHRVEATGDADKEDELLRAAIARARKRHGL